MRILDDRTLLIPDRPGNRIADTLTNLLADPSIGLLFLIPGVGDSFRVNGRALITDDQELLADSEVAGSVPRLGIIVSIEEAYTQCSKALIRSDLWNPERHIDRSELPSSGEILRSLNDPEFDADTVRPRARRAVRARRRSLLTLKTSSVDREQVDDEHERLVRLDHAAGPACAVRQRRRDRQLPPSADLHALDTGVPARESPGRARA